MTTTDPQEAELLCDRVVLIDQGRVRAYGNVAALKGLLQNNGFLSSVATSLTKESAGAV
jgi:ABC-type multidrug transport system ATPase subunit